MKHRKRSTHLLIVLSLLLAMFLQACSGGSSGGNEPKPTNNNSSTGSNVANTPEPEPTEPQLKPYEVSIAYQGTPERDVALVEEKLNEFFRENINATVKLMPIAKSEYKQKTELMMNSGEKMDLVFTASWLDFFSNVTKGAFIELDELLDQHGAGIKETLNPLYLEAPRFEKKLYAIPTNKEITQSRAFTMRKDIVDKYNIPVEQIKKLEDIEPYVKLVSENEKDIIAFFSAGGLGGGDGMMYESRSNYRPIGPVAAKSSLFFYDYTQDKNIQIKSILDPEIYEINKAELELTRSFYEKGYTNRDAATSKENITDLAKLGKIWFQRTVWKPGTDIEQSNSVNNLYEYVSSVVDEPLVTTDMTTGSMFAISRTSEDPERAMMVLNYLHTDPYLVNLIVHGIEDVHYKKVGENRIEPIADSGYGTAALFWVIGNQMINYLKPGQPDDLYTNWMKYNDEARRSPILGFVFDDRNVKNEVSQMLAIAAEYQAITSGGIANPMKLFEERNEKFKAAGIEKVKEELQAQVTAWEASK